MFNSNNYSNVYGSYSSNQNCNYTYVTSLEEALSRHNISNTEGVYFHQDLPLFYRIRMESDGKKYWQEFQYNVSKNTLDNAPLVKADLTSVLERLQRIEERVFQDGEVSDEKSNG